MKENKFNKKCFIAFLTLWNTTCLSINASEKISDQKIKSNNQLFETINNKKMEINFKAPENTTKKPTVVIVHAFGCVSADAENKIYNTNYSKDYDMLTNMLVEKGFKTAVISRLGYGKSDDSDSPRTNENIVKEMRAALKENNIEPPYILVGHSMGNLFCLEWIKSNEKDISVYVGLDGMNPHYYYLPTMDNCPSLPDPKNFCPSLMDLKNKNLISNSMYKECLYQNQNMWSLGKFKFPEKMPVRMFLSAGLLNNIGDKEQGIEGWDGKMLQDKNKELFSNSSNQKIICLEDGDHFLYRSGEHAKMIVSEIENIVSKCVLPE